MGPHLHVIFALFWETFDLPKELIKCGFGVFICFWCENPKGATTVSCSEAFWSPNGGVGSNPTSDTMSCSEAFSAYSCIQRVRTKQLTLTVTRANGALVSLRTHAGDYIVSIDCYARAMITTKHHIRHLWKKGARDEATARWSPVITTPACEMLIDLNPFGQR